MEPWAKEWLEAQRSKGVKCLEIKQRCEKHYVYHSTTHWDRERGKAIKTSKYLGRLYCDASLIDNSFDNVIEPIREENICAASGA
jgi:hypothetical protein